MYIVNIDKVNQVNPIIILCFSLK